MSRTRPVSDPDHGIAVHVAESDQLLGYATRAATPTDLVVTPEQLHRRNLKRRLAARRRPRSSMQFRSTAHIAGDVLGAVDRPAGSLDRIDRIRRLEDLLEATPEAFSRFDPLFGTPTPDRAADVEAVRRTVEVMTGFDDDRLDAVEELAETLSAVARRDTEDYVAGGVAVESLLDDRSESFVSADGAVRAATEVLRRRGQSAWDDAFEGIERLHLAGVSSVGASLEALLHAIATRTDVAVHVYLRAGTGPRIRRQLRGTCEGETPRATDAVAAGVPVTALVGETRAEEARVAFGVVDALVSAGASMSDVLVVAREVDAYERALSRAGRQAGYSVSLWTQLDVLRTRPYALVSSACDLAAAGERSVDADSVLRPLAVGWTPPGTDEEPVASRALTEAHGVLTERDARPPEEWAAVLADADAPAAVAERARALREWVETRPATPTPADVRDAFAPLLEAYREGALPAVRARDDAALTATTRAARALVRVETLVDEVAEKYASWLEEERAERSWETARYLLETIATVEPGRREHANAAVIDVVDATDAWLRRVPYVVAVGLVDGVWPQPPDGVLPVEFRNRVLAGERPAARAVVPREGWSERRELDHFASAVSAATDHLVCTRYARETDGTTARPSPFLDALDATRLGERVTSQLLAADRPVPEDLVRALSLGVER